MRKKAKKEPARARFSARFKLSPFVPVNSNLRYKYR